MQYSNQAYKNKLKLRTSGFREPLEMGGIMMLFILGVVMFPTRKMVGWVYKGGEEYVFLLAEGVVRLLFTGMMFYFIRSFGFRVLAPFSRIIDYVAVLPALLVAVNNFPFVSYLMGDCSLAEGGLKLFAFTVWCVGVGVFEETAFRGVIFPLCLVLIKKWRGKNGKKTDRPVFWTVVLSSAVFALTHLVNLLNGNIGGTFLQVGYTFLIGAMCGISLAKTGNLFFSMLLHVIYNFGGMIMDGAYCGSGVMWTWPQIIFTAVIGVIAGAYLIVVAFKLDKVPEASEYLLGDGFEELLTLKKEGKEPKAQ